MRIKDLKSNFLYKLIISMYCKYKAAFYIIFRVFPINKNKIIFSNFIGNGYGDNPKYIAEYILKNSKKYELVWLVKNEIMRNNNIPKGIKVVRINSIRAIYETVTSKVWIDNVRTSETMKKRKKQLYIQTWHGAPALKKIEKDAESKLPIHYLNRCKLDSKKIDIFLSNSNFMTKLIKDSFWYSGDILECGSPRNDILFRKNTNLLNFVKEKYEINEKNKIILYAPTFRNSFSVDIYDLDYIELINVLREKYLCNWTVLVRLHPNFESKELSVNFSDNVINVTRYDDMQELLAVSDILITDYSSSMFDFSLTGKPCFLYIPDIVEYEGERGFYFDISKLPFESSKTNEELIEKIRYFDLYEYQKRIKNFHYDISYFEQGDACEKVIKYIEDNIEN